MIFDIWYMIHIMYSLYCNTCIGTSKYTIFLPTFFPETPPPSWARCCVLSNDHEHPNCQIFAGPNSNWLHHHKSHRAAIDFFVGFCWRNGCVLKMLNFECHMRGKWNSFAMILAYIDIVCALVHALFRPQTKTHFEDTFLSGRVRERRREDTFRRHIKRNFPPKTNYPAKTHFEDTLNEDEFPPEDELPHEDKFRRHIKRRQISPRRRITQRRHISKTH